jgi:peptidoglycan/xylan/chitin deacetylase (PgdA/CDA1 family)
MMTRDTGYRALGRLATAYTRFSRRGDRLRILAYHEVPDRDAFAVHMAWLRSVLIPMPLEPAIDRLVHGDLPPGAVVVTFDDGHPSLVENALPVLDRFEIPATAFVCPGLVDTPEPYWWQVVDRAVTLGLSDVGDKTWTVAQLKAIDDSMRRDVVADIRAKVEDNLGAWSGKWQLSSSELEMWAASGHSIGNHTWDHPILDRCDHESQLHQISKAHRWLVERFDESTSFAYPNGNLSPSAKEGLASLGYRCALLFDHRVARPGDQLALSRIRVNATDPLPEFQAKASGLHPVLSDLRGSYAPRAT